MFLPKPTLGRRILATLAGVLLITACNGKTQKRLDEAEAELATLREAIKRLEPQTAPTPTAAPTPGVKPPAPPKSADPLAQKVNTMRLQTSRTRNLVDGLDDDLASLEDHVDGHMERIDALRDAVDELGAVVDEHANVINTLGYEVDTLSEQVRELQVLGSYVFVEDGQVVVAGADLVLRQSRGKDGLLQGNGNLFTMVEPPRER